MEPIEIVEHTDPKSGLKGFIAFCGDKSKPAIGGCRMMKYASVDDAKIEAERLARSMFFKARSHDLPLSGAKAVLIEPENVDVDALWPAFASMVNAQKGRYITAVDTGTSEEVMNLLSQHTNYLTCYSNLGGDPSFYTAKGVAMAIDEVVKHRFNGQSVHVLVQGVGKVGRHLIEMLLEQGHAITACDINPSHLEGLDIDIVGVDNFLKVECDIFAPCALGRVIDDQFVQKAKTKVICGAANDQLIDGQILTALAHKKIFYCHDYLVNGGGLLCCYAQYNNLGNIWLENKLVQLQAKVRKLF